MSKGVGYVSFAIKEDASSAIETIERDGLLLEGRKIRVNWADRKVSWAHVKRDGLVKLIVSEGENGRQEG